VQWKSSPDSWICTSIPLLIASSSDFGSTGIRMNTPEFATAFGDLVDHAQLALPISGECTKSSSAKVNRYQQSVLHDEARL